MDTFTLNGNTSYAKAYSQILLPSDIPQSTPPQHDAPHLTNSNSASQSVQLKCQPTIPSGGDTQSRDINNMSTSSSPHSRQNTPNNIRRPKEVHFQLFPKIPITNLLHSTHKRYHQLAILNVPWLSWARGGAVLLLAVFTTTSIFPNRSSASAIEL